MKIRRSSFLFVDYFAKGSQVSESLRLSAPIPLPISLRRIEADEPAFRRIDVYLCFVAHLRLSEKLILLIFKAAGRCFLSLLRLAVLLISGIINPCAASA